MNIDYKELTEKVKWHLDNVKDLAIYKLTKKFAVNMLSDLDMEYDEMCEPISLELVEKLAEDFFADLDKDLLDNYLNIRDRDFANVNFVSLDNLKETSEYSNSVALEKYEEGLIDWHEKNDIFWRNFIYQDYSTNDSRVDENGNLTVYLTGTIEDLFLIVHEFVHKIFFQNLNGGKMPDSHNFLVEVPAILVESLLVDYLIEKNVHVRDAKIYKNNRFVSTQDNAYNFMFEMMLIEIVEKYGEITPKLIDLYISKYDDDIKEILLFVKDAYLTEAINKGLFYYRSNRYILALVFSCYFKELIYQDKRNLNILYELGKSIFEDNYKEVLEKLGIKYFDLSQEEFVLNENVAQMLINSYLKEVAEFKRLSNNLGK